MSWDEKFSVREVFPGKSPLALAEIVELHSKCFRTAELDMNLFKQGHWWIVYLGNFAVGFAGMVPSKRWGDAVYFCRSGVHPDYRGRGIQKRLIRARLAKARKLGMNWAITDTRRNPASANSLISEGFRMYQPALPWSFKDACYWRKKL